MTPEEITTLFATAAAAFQPISGQPTNDDLTAIRNVLYPLLLDIPYDEAGTHNLTGSSSQQQHTPKHGGMHFPSLNSHQHTPTSRTQQPPSSAPAVRRNMPSLSRIL